MTRILRDRDIETITAMIDGWTNANGPLTWEAMVDAVEARIGHRFTRQGLNKVVAIKTAYKVRKEALRNGERIIAGGSIELRKALERIARLEAENERLETQNTVLKEQFARWLYNAATRGLDERFLNQPLPPINREPTKDRRLARRR